MTNGDTKGGNSGTGTDHNKPVELGQDLCFWVGVGVGIIGVPIAIFGTPWIGGLVTLFGIGIIIFSYFLPNYKTKFCLCDIIASDCREEWLGTRKTICIACAKGQEKCTEGDRDIEMWDAPLNAEIDPHTTGKCTIRVRCAVNCDEKCDSPTITSPKYKSS